MKQLISDVARLRRTCPWYKAQTLETTREYLIEETQEVLDALNNNPAAFRDELGDLLFEVLVFSEIASGLGWFSMQDVMDGLHEKIIRRNPHVFGDLKLDSIDAVNRHWQLVKASEMKVVPLIEKNKMSDPEILMIDRQAIVFLREECSICFSTLPPASIQLAPGYTLSAWIWSALNEALETAKFSMSDSEMMEIATRISHQAAELV